MGRWKLGCFALRCALLCSTGRRQRQSGADWRAQDGGGEGTWVLAPELAPLGSVDVMYTAYGNIDEEDFLYYR